MYGGGFVTIPAYLRDLFGAYQVGAIHGPLITAWSVAGHLPGPSDLVASRDPEAVSNAVVISDRRQGLKILEGNNLPAHGRSFDSFPIVNERSSR
jgi:hypothetical protein